MWDVAGTLECNCKQHVHITTDLRWDKHIDNICSRANSSLGFIRRNVNTGNTRVKGLAYQSYVPRSETKISDVHTGGMISDHALVRFTLSVKKSRLGVEWITRRAYPAVWVGSVTC